MEGKRETRIFFIPDRVEEARKVALNGRRITNKEIAENLHVSERHISVISCRNRLFIKGVKTMTDKLVVLGAFNWQIAPDIRIELDGPEGDVKILGKVLSVVSIRKVSPLT